MIPSEHASGRGLGILRDEGIEVVLADGDLAARARLLNQPFRKHARTGRPWVLFKSAMSLDGKVATRSGDSKWISGEASRRLRPSLARRVRRRRGRDRHRAGRRPAAHRPRARAFGRQPRRVVFDSLARLPLGAKLVRDARRIPLTVVVSRAAPRAATDALETHGVEVIVAPGENEPARVSLGARPARRRRDQLDPAGGRPASGRRVPRRRRDRRGPAVPGPAGARRPHRARSARGRGRRGDRRRRARADAGLRAGRRGPAGVRTDEGVVSVFTGLVADLGRVVSARALGRWSAPGGRHLAGRRAQRGRLDRRQRRVPDRDRGRRRALQRRRHERDPAPELARRTSTPEPRSTSSCRCGPPTGSAATSSRATSTASGRSSAAPRTGSPGGCRSRRPTRCCATSSRRARSPSTAFRSRWPASTTDRLPFL